MSLTRSSVKGLVRGLTLAAVLSSSASINALTSPTGFTYTPSFTIYKRGSNYYTNFDIDAQKPAVTKTYYVSTTGSDAADGLTTGTALRGIDTALAKADADEIVIAAGTYHDANGWNGTVPTRSLVIRASGGRVISTRKQTQTWSLDQGETYKATTAATQAAVDIARTAADGAFERLTLAADLATCRATRGTYFSDGTTYYATLGNGRAPDTDFFLPSTNDNGRTGASAVTWWIENIDFVGGALAFNHAPGAQAALLYMKNCSFQASASDNAFRHSGGGTSVLQGCMSANAFADGFNYAQSTAHPTFIELACYSTGCGIQSAGTANNATTSHNSAKGLRIKDAAKAGPWGNPGVYKNAQNRVLIDINSALSWNLGITIGPSRATDSTSVGVSAGSADGQAAKIWLDGCTIVASASQDLFAYSGSQINYRNMSIAGLVTGGTGTIQAFTS